MTTKYQANASTLIATFGNGAHRIIDAYHAGAVRLADLADQRWNHSFKEASPRLSVETRKNAAHAHEVFAGYYAKSLELSTSGAKIVVDTLVGAAVAAVERVTAATQERAHKAA